MPDRREFIRLAGLATLGTACCSQFLGCSDYEVEIPCLGPAPPPTTIPGMTYIRASQIGCALDCDLAHGKNKNGHGEATDDGPRINAAMANASASSPITLIVDGPALISGLFLPAAGHWSIAGLGCGTGFYIKTGTNNDGIHNGSAIWMVDETGPPAPPRGGNVSLSNFTINGNAGDGRNGDSTAGYPQGNLKTGQECYPISLQNLDNITIENIVVVNSPCYHMRLNNVGNVAISGCIMRSFGPNTDGLHFEGPANDIAITGCEFGTGDDAIALNCPEGYSGDISNVTVSNCKFQSPTLMRLDTIEYAYGARFNINDVTVRDCTGTTIGPCFEIGDGAGGNPAAVASLVIADCNFSAPAVLNIWANFGTLRLQNVTLSPADAQGEAPGYAFARTNLRLLQPDSGMYSGSKLSFENCTILGNGGTKVSALIVENNSEIAVVEFNGLSIKASKSQELVNILSGSIGQLVIDSLASTNIGAAVSSAGFANVGSVSGAGVLSTGWQFPDSVMANNVPYISASTGKPSIKIDGIVEPYP